LEPLDRFEDLLSIRRHGHERQVAAPF
jgi:hypothetical protein